MGKADKQRQKLPMALMTGAPPRSWEDGKARGCSDLSASLPPRFPTGQRGVSPALGAVPDSSSRRRQSTAGLTPSLGTAGRAANGGRASRPASRVNVRAPPGSAQSRALRPTAQRPPCSAAPPARAARRHSDAFLPSSSRLLLFLLPTRRRQRRRWRWRPRDEVRSRSGRPEGARGAGRCGAVKVGTSRRLRPERVLRGSETRKRRSSAEPRAVLRCAFKSGGGLREPHCHPGRGLRGGTEPRSAPESRRTLRSKG